MTTTTETTTTRTCPPSAVVDQIVPWLAVQPGEVVLWDGEFRHVEHINPMDYGNPAFVLDGDTHNGTIPVGDYAAVRRYTEGSVTLTAAETALAAAALDEAAEDRYERARASCPDCTYTGDGMCTGQREHAERASEYRELRDRLEAGR